MKTTAYTDGSCPRNPGPGGWAVTLLHGPEGPRSYSGALERTTNNEAELKAIFEATLFCDPGSELRVISDSKLALGWLFKGFRRRAPRIRELCRSIEESARARGVTLSGDWVKGHELDPGNRVVARLARRAARRAAPETL